MALHINNKSDWNEMFDKFATMPKERDKAANTPINGPKKEEDTPEAKGDTEQKNTKA